MTAPRMGTNEGAVRKIDARSNFSRRQPIQHVWGLVVQVGSVTELLRPNTTLIVFWPMQG